MNWTPDYNYNGNNSGWDDGNPNGYRVDDAVVARSSPGRAIGGWFLRLFIAVLLIAGVIAMYFTARLTPSLATQQHKHSQRKSLSR